MNQICDAIYFMFYVILRDAMKCHTMESASYGAWICGDEFFPAWSTLPRGWPKLDSMYIN